jgi:hypothetical protein
VRIGKTPDALVVAKVVHITSTAMLVG